MKIDLASIESAEFVLENYPFSSQEIHGRFGYHPEYETIENQTYDDGRRVIVDNRQFRKCNFVRCLLVYSGGLYGFQECEFGIETRLAVTGSAARTIALWRAIHEHPDRPVLPY
jgi:hypothetical protein